MRVLTGTDIIEINRIKESIESLGEIFKNKIYTEKEIEYCESKKNAKYQHYAGRFATKEAIFKAVSDLLDDKFEISWKDAEVLNDKNGRPTITFKSKKLQERIESIDVSISHCKDYAVANVVLITFER
jgi:holo-[acyl-carrier protein] synthase